MTDDTPTMNDHRRDPDDCEHDEGGHHAGRLVRSTGSKLLRSDKLLYTFLRSGVSSQTAGWCDLLLCFALFHWAGMQPWSATALGAVFGGVVNCIINYKFTFHASNCSWKAVIVKYTMVWMGSLLLNSVGTELLYRWISTWQWLDDMGFKPDGYLAAARLTVSLIVSWFWNFVLQRYFVYRPVPFDRHAIRFVNLLLHRKKSNQS